MKHLLILLLFIGAAATAQRINFYPDSVRIELPDQKTMIVFEMRDFKKDSAFIRNFPPYLREILGYVKKSQPANFSETGPYHIEVRVIGAGEKEILSVGGENSYLPVGEKTLISIKKIEKPETQLTIKEKQIVELLPPGWELSILSKENKVTLYSESFNAMRRVDSLNFSPLSSRLIKEFKPGPFGKRTIQSRMVVRDNKIDQSKFILKYPGDQIILNGSGGIGIFRDRIYPQLSASLSLVFRDRFTKPNIRTSLTTDFLFFTERTVEGFQMNTNQFVSLSFEKNFNNKTKEPQWAGIGVGLLTYKAGDYFTGNTMKFFITHNNKHVSLSPEFYLTNNFKTFTFGTTLRYTF